MKAMSRWLLSIAVMALAVVLLAPVAYAAPPIPHSFYGTLKINGQDAPVGTVVTAKFGAGTIAGTHTTSQAGKYGDVPTSSYLAVSHDNLVEGETLRFYVNGVDTGQTAQFVPGGGPTQLNLPGGLGVMRGDASGDGVLNAADITAVERIIAGLDPSTPGADASLDGLLNALDITKVERLIARLD